MKILYNSVKQHIKNQEGQMIFAYMFASFAGGLLLWHIADKIVKFSSISPQLELIFT